MDALAVVEDFLRAGKATRLAIGVSIALWAIFGRMKRVTKFQECKILILFYFIKLKLPPKFSTRLMSGVIDIAEGVNR